MDYSELEEFWQRKLEETLEMLKNRKPIPAPEPIYILPPLPRLAKIEHEKEKVAKFRIVERGKKEGGWTYWMIYKDGHFWRSADTKEEALRDIRAEGYSI